MSFQELFPIQFITAEQWPALLPLVFSGFGAVIALLLAPWPRFGRLGACVALVISSSLALLLLALSSQSAPVSVLGGVLVFDRLSQVFSAMALTAGIASALMVFGFDLRENLLSEIYSLIGFAVSGMILLVSTRDLVMLFIGLELMSLAIYVMVGMRRQSAEAAEAGLKYFLLGGAASAVLLYGATLLYGSTGSLKFDEIGRVWEQLWSSGDRPPMLAVVGLVLVGIGFLFKLGAVPFQVWVPDVYEGAATPVTGFMITAVKASAVGALLRLSSELFAMPGLLAPGGIFYWLLWTIVAVTLLLGALVGLRQTSLKRMLAYSTIAHTGYVLLGFLALIIGQKPDAAEAITSYTLFYMIMNLGGFAVLTLLSPEGSDDLSLEDLTGLGQRRPYLALALSLFLLSMAGIPPTAGFLGKYYLFMSALSAGQISLTVVAVLASIISAAFYLRPLVYMYMRDREPNQAVSTNFHWLGSSVVVGITAVLTVAIGVLPAWLGNLLK